jgi:leucyl aminopeptidase
MQTTVENKSAAEVNADAVVALCFEKNIPADLNRLTAGWFDEIVNSGEFAGKMLDFAVLHRPAGMKAKRLVAAGCGSAEKFTGAEMRKVAGAAVRKLKAAGAKSIALLLEGDLAAQTGAAIEGAILGDFETDGHKSEREVKTVDSFTVISTAGTAVAERARIVAESQNLARDLVNEPANLLTPAVLAARARAVAEETGLECEILDRDRMQQLGMGSLLGVAQGSSEPPFLIVLRYKTESKDHLALVGKGVTFDTGGVSIKPSDGMEKMKYDMAGGAAVIGAMRAIAMLKPPVSVTALIPAVENMCSHNAQRPGDIVTSLSGKTIEVLNTDAEGRLILVDAIEYARRLGCTHMVDAATLTGAIVVALGHVHVGAFSNDDAMLQRVLNAAKSQGEKMWHMPLDDEYKEYLKNSFADLSNIGGRYGGAVTAAYFIKEFTGGTPWVHLDIAGTAWLDEAKPHMAKGPSGVAVRTFIDLAMSW